MHILALESLCSFLSFVFQWECEPTGWRSNLSVRGAMSALAFNALPFANGKNYKPIFGASESLPRTGRKEVEIFLRVSKGQKSLKRP